MSEPPPQEHDDHIDDYLDDAMDVLYQVRRQRTDSELRASSGSVGSAPVATKPFVPPARIGPYEILNVIGEGGLGIILRARDPELGR